MTLEIGSKNRVLAALKGRGVQIVVIGVLAVTWWRGEEWLTDLARADESAVAAQKLVSAEAARAALGLATVEVMVSQTLKFGLSSVVNPKVGFAKNVMVVT